MKIVTHGEIQGADFSSADLLLCLSQIVVSKTDEEIDKKQILLEQLKNNHRTSLDMLKGKKVELDNLNSEKTRLLQLNRTLSLIETLKKEGRLIGKNLATISRLITDIENYDFAKLRSLEEKLSMYLPESYSKT